MTPLVALTVAGLALVGCGDDDEAATATTEDAGADPSEGDGSAEEADEGGEGADSEYCVLTAELDEQDDFPSVEQLEALDAAAPDEISDEISLVVTAFREASEAGDPGAAFADPAVEEAFGPIEAYEAQVCGLGDDEEEEEAEQDPSVTELDPDAAQVAVTATEYAFDFDAPSAGPTSFTMTNDGEETHVMLVAKLAEGATLEDALASEGDDEFVEEEFESDIAEPGDEAVITAELTAGDWVMICYLPNTEGQPHFTLGQAEEFTVE
jgi:hypothetical protein